MHTQSQLFADSTFVLARKGPATYLQSPIHSFISMFLREGIHLTAVYSGIVIGCWQTTSCSCSHLYYFFYCLLYWPDAGSPCSCHFMILTIRQKPPSASWSIITCLPIRSAEDDCSGFLDAFFLYSVMDMKNETDLVNRNWSYELDRFMKSRQLSYTFNIT